MTKLRVLSFLTCNAWPRVCVTEETPVLHGGFSHITLRCCSSFIEAILHIPLQCVKRLFGCMHTLMGALLTQTCSEGRMNNDWFREFTNQFTNQILEEVGPRNYRSNQ